MRRAVELFTFASTFVAGCRGGSHEAAPASTTSPASVTSEAAMPTRPAASGFATAVQPVAEKTLIVTDTDGLLAGDVEIPAGDRAIPAYRAMPSGGTNLPVVLVVQEIFGLHEHIKDVARRFAKLGYLAVAPALYARQGDVLSMKTIPEIREVVARVPDAQVLSDLDACMTWADAHGGDPARLAVTGFCWGGRIVWLYAAHQPKLKAAVAWYGKLKNDATNDRTPTSALDAASALKAPVLGLYGGQDPSIPPDQVERLRRVLASAHSPSVVEVYPNSPHAFFADYRASYRKEDAEDGWRRLRAWFKEHGV